MCSCKTLKTRPNDNNLMVRSHCELLESRFETELFLLLVKMQRKARNPLISHGKQLQEQLVYYHAAYRTESRWELYIPSILRRTSLIGTNLWKMTEEMQEKSQAPKSMYGGSWKRRMERLKVGPSKMIHEHLVVPSLLHNIHVPKSDELM